MKKLLFSILAAILTVTANADTGKSEFQALSDSLTAFLCQSTTVQGRVSVKSITADKGRLQVQIGDDISDFPLRDKDIESIYDIIAAILPKYACYRDNGKIKLTTTKGIAVESLKSNYYSEKPSRSPISEHARLSEKKRDDIKPLVVNESRPYEITRGLQSRHIAIWQSHGRYYEQSLDRWEWQRARILQTVEDLYTQSYILPFLEPMLENAGAVVLIPRERDWNTCEVVVDNDGFEGEYSERGLWVEAPVSGFANPRSSYEYGENPFHMGTAIMAESADGDSKPSVVKWIPDFEKAGEYAVYVSYCTMAKSTQDAHYSVVHKGGRSEFSVNQTMGGGTWIYLGKFSFDSHSMEQGVYLTNESTDRNSIITADAVKFGGGMGNMARKPAHPTYEVTAITSGYPRFTEGARYWLQWAGFDTDVYSTTNGENDYKDDSMARGLWVNKLIGGTWLNPDEKGYNIPLDLSFALHSDSGASFTDSIVGSLAIYTKVSEGKSTYKNGESRTNARELADLVQTEIVEDIRRNYEPQWSRRQLWDRSYAESRVPEVPSMIMELLSHQNLADMRYGLDPSFRFTVSRSIYKGILKYLAYINNFDFTVQPLPVNSFAIQLDGSEARLSWKPTDDPVEATASPTGYILYTRVDGGSFDIGKAVDGNSCSITLEPGHLYSFRITACNAGGESFPSETLSAGLAESSKGTVLVVNNFTRVSAPVSFASADSTYAGFINRTDSGVPYIEDISYTGAQHEFRRTIPWYDDDSAGFGASDSDYETMAIAGNTFDYPSVHGQALMDAGYSFTSSSRDAFAGGIYSPSGFTAVDIICGKQLTTQVGRRGAAALKYSVFPEKIQSAIRSWANAGKSILVSGSYLASDIWEPVFDYEITKEMEATYFRPAKDFAQKVLHYRWMTNFAATEGRAYAVQNSLGINLGQRLDFNTEPNERIYAVDAADGIIPDGKGACTIYRYLGSISAGVAYSGKYKVIVLGFPIETLEPGQIRTAIGGAMQFFEAR